jgi:hypothetical protein
VKKLIHTIQQAISSAKSKQLVPNHIKRPIRIKIHESHQVYFEKNKERVLINNMNSKGFGFLGKSFSILPKKGDIIKGILTIETESFPIELEVVYSGKNVGCKIILIERNCLKKISQYFSFELVAQSLYPLNSEHLKKDPDGTPIFYVGEDSCELYFVENNKNLIKFSVTLFGNYIEIDKNHNIRHGRVSGNSEELEKNLTYKKSDLILTSQEVLAEEQKNKIERFILSIENLSQEYKTEMIKLLHTVNKHK